MSKEGKKGDRGCWKNREGKEIQGGERIQLGHSSPSVKVGVELVRNRMKEGRSSTLAEGCVIPGQISLFVTKKTNSFNVTKWLLSYIM